MAKPRSTAPPPQKFARVDIARLPLQSRRPLKRCLPSLLQLASDASVHRRCILCSSGGQWKVIRARTAADPSDPEPASTSTAKDRAPEREGPSVVQPVTALLVLCALRPAGAERK